MKRFALPLLFLTILLTGLLSCHALVPGRFTGIWYEEQTGDAYLFREGIIQRAEDDTFRGAYGFTRSSITLFVSGVENLDAVQTLCWISGKEGQALCTEAGEICFRRTP